MSDVKVSFSVELPGGFMPGGSRGPVLQSMGISDKAYSYMTSTEAPRRFDAVKWGKMTRKDRLLYHLGLIAGTLGGKVAGYVVFMD